MRLLQVNYEFCCTAKYNFSHYIRFGNPVSTYTCWININNKAKEGVNYV